MDNQRMIRQLVLLLLLMAALGWVQMPDWQRRMIVNRVRYRARRMVGWMAHRTGHRAMGDELDGRQAEADAGYGFTFRLSSLRDRL